MIANTAPSDSRCHGGGDCSNVNPPCLHPKDDSHASPSKLTAAGVAMKTRTSKAAAVTTTTTTTTANVLQRSPCRSRSRRRLRPPPFRRLVLLLPLLPPHSPIPPPLSPSPQPRPRLRSLPSPHPPDPSFWITPTRRGHLPTTRHSYLRQSTHSSHSKSKNKNENKNNKTLTRMATRGGENPPSIQQKQLARLIEAHTEAHCSDRFFFSKNMYPVQYPSPSLAWLCFLDV